MCEPVMFWQGVVIVLTLWIAVLTLWIVLLAGGVWLVVTILRAMGVIAG